MISLEPRSSGDSTEEKCLELRQQLEEYVQKADKIEALLLSDEMTSDERLKLEKLKKRYSQAALDLMMQIDLLEDPEE